MVGGKIFNYGGKGVTMITELPRSTVLGLPRIFFAGGHWRHVAPVPMLVDRGSLLPSDWARHIQNAIKAGEFCNYLNGKK